MSAHSSEDLNNPHLSGRESLRRGDIAAAVRALEQAAKREPDSLLVAFDLGRAYGALGRFQDARTQFERAIAWPGQESQTYLALGYTLGELGDWRAAARAMPVVLNAAPDHLQALGSLSECAHRLALRGEPVPRNLQTHAGPSAGQLEGTISIVCSVDHAKLERLQGNLETLLRGEDWELIHIADARSLCEGYNRGVAHSRGDILVFCHDDIAIFCADFASRLRTHLASFDLWGVAGSTLATGPTWTWSGAPHTFASIAYPRSDDTDQMQLATCGTSGPVVKGAQLLDGVFMAARRDLLDRVSFDEATFDGFHLYDLDFSYRAWLAGARTAVCRDVAICHESRGKFKTANYRHYAERYRRKFPDACLAAAAGKTLFAENVIEKPSQLQPTVDWLNYLLANPTAPAAAL